MIKQFCRARFAVVVAMALSLVMSYGAPHASAQEGPRVTVQPSSAAPGETVSITGTGWPAGAQLTARLYAKGSGPSGPLADLIAPFDTDGSGSFSFQATVPLALQRLDDSSYHLYLVPGQYNLLVQSGQELSYSTPFTAAAPRQGALLWGEMGFDKDGNGQFDVYHDIRAGSGVAVTLTPAGGTPIRALTDAFGRYMFASIPAGSYTLRAESQYQGASWVASATVSAPEAQATKVDLALDPGTAGPPAIPHDERYFSETGYRIDRDGIWNYFNGRGGVEVFGFPVSRTFTLLGCPVQVFQREIVQACPGQGPQLMNLLDPDLFPYTRVNGSVFPAPDEALKRRTPRADDPSYATLILDFVRANAPDVWNGRPVNFGKTFFGLVTPEMVGTSDQGLLGLMNLEVWGAPISLPMPDPGNDNFVYQRFQRGIMHYDATSGVTRGVLLADYLKQIMRNSPELPADLRDQAQGSRFFAQYAPDRPSWLARPDQLPGTDLTFAFEQG